MRKMHGIEVPASEMLNESNIPKKLRQIEKYMDSDVRTKNDEKILEFINENINKCGVYLLCISTVIFIPEILYLQKVKKSV